MREMQFFLARQVEGQRKFRGKIPMICGLFSRDRDIHVLRGQESATWRTPL